MKKMFKGIAVLAATAAVGASVAFATGCNGTNGKYIGHYCYDNYGQVYGVVVEVTVENNIITKVEDVTASYKDDNGKGKISHTFKNPYANGAETTIDNTQWHTYSAPWEEYFANGYASGSIAIADDAARAAYEADNTKLPQPDQCVSWGAPVSYSWFKSDTDKWNKGEAWLLQQYEGKSVADVLDMKVYIANNGEPYETGYNAEFGTSGLVISGATQGSGRIALAVQNALGKTVDIGWVK